MTRSLIVLSVLITGAIGLSYVKAGYPVAGKDYIRKVKQERKSIRTGSGHFVPYGAGSRSFRRGK